MKFAAIALIGLLMSQFAHADPATFAKALADPARPVAQTEKDAARRPAELIAFAGLKPGDRIADFMSGGGYFTRIFSGVVGPRGHVYAFAPTEEIRTCEPEETAGTLNLSRERTYRNVTVEVGPVGDFAAPEPLDMVWTAQNFHDLYDPFMGPADIARVTGAVFRALKPGGVFIVIDHAAEAGSGTRDTDTLHRIDPAAIRQAVTAAGFVFEGESAVLRNPDDTHRLRVFDPAIRGRTDQVVFKFRKPPA
jgi:predicted methyltransferase